ncbi:MAG: flagellar biosynthesis anti-sigma factor FlgM [Bdellovibrionota bacterium]
MRVGQSGNNQVQGSETGQARRTEKSSQATTESARDGTKVSTENGDVDAKISARARDLSKAKSAAAGAPDVREEKIAELKRRIAEGRYKVDSAAVADKMVDDHLGGLGAS